MLTSVFLLYTLQLTKVILVRCFSQGQKTTKTIRVRPAKIKSYSIQVENGKLPRFHQHRTKVCYITRASFKKMVLRMADKFTVKMRVQFAVVVLTFSTQLQHRETKVKHFALVQVLILRIYALLELSDKFIEKIQVKIKAFSTIENKVNVEFRRESTNQLTILEQVAKLFRRSTLRYGCAAKI